LSTHPIDEYAERERVRLMERKLDNILDKLIGIPYQHNGRSYEGVDCWGLVYLFFKELGFPLPVNDGRNVPQDWYLKEPERYINGIRTLGEEVGHYRNLGALDLPYFRLYRNVITHSGVMLDEMHFLHVLIDTYAGAIRIDLIHYS